MATNDQFDSAALGTAPKPGYRTTEFGLTVAHQLLMAAFFFKMLPAKDAPAAQATVDTFIPALGIAVSSAASVVAYIYSRMHVKTQPVAIAVATEAVPQEDPQKVPLGLLGTDVGAGTLIPPRRIWPFDLHGRRHHVEPTPPPTPQPMPEPHTRWRPRPRPPIVPPIPTPVIPPVPPPVVPPAPPVPTPPSPMPLPTPPPAPMPVFRPDDPDVHEGDLIR
jgi:hypothetical protein